MNWPPIYRLKSLLLHRMAPPSGIYDVSPPVWNLRAVSLISLFYISPLLFFCLVLLLFVSNPFLLLAHSLDFFFLKSPFSEAKVGSFVWLLLSFLSG